VAGLPPLGCLPLQMTLKLKFDRQCLMNENADSEKYNRKLTQRLIQLQYLLPESKIIYVDLYHPLLKLFTNPQDHGKFLTINIVFIVKLLTSFYRKLVCNICEEFY